MEKLSDERKFVYEWALEILKGDGKVEALNALRVMTVYEDQKIQIRGFFDKQGEGVEALSVALQQKTNAGELIPRFRDQRLPIEDKVLVYYWEGFAKLYRPGHWIYYLRDLKHQHDAEIEATRKLDGKPVDDDALFPNLITDQAALQK